MSTLLLIDVVLDFWKRQDSAGVQRWALFLCGRNKLPYYNINRKYGHGHNSAVTTEFEAREMFGMFSAAGNYIGVAGGKLSGGIFAFDIDVKSEKTPEALRNPDSLESWIISNYNDLPHTAIQTTKSGGRHRIYYNPEINSKNNIFDGDNTGIYCDIKGNGGYFILYDTGIDFDAITESPDWMYSITGKEKRTKSEAPFSEDLTAGNRNSGLASVAGRFYNYGDDIDILRSFLHGHNQLHCKPPLTEKEIETIVKSVSNNFTRNYEKTNISENDFDCLSDFLIAIKPESFVLQDMLIEGGLHIFTGVSGSGKTWVATDLCLSIAQGLNWLGKSTIQKNVFIMDEESGKDRLIRRMRKMAIGRELMPITIKDGGSEFTDKIKISGQTIRQSNILDKIFIQKLKEKIILENIGFILMDALVDITPGANENDAKEMIPALLNLRWLCEETGVTILLIHHAGKSEESSSRGTSAIEGGVDTMFKISLNKKSGKTTIESKKERDIKYIKFSFVINYSDYDVKIETTETDKEINQPFLSKSEKFILKYLLDEGCSSKTDIEKSAIDKIKTGTLHAGFLSLMNNKKYIYRVNNGGKGSKAEYNIIEEKRIQIEILLSEGYKIEQLL